MGGMWEGNQHCDAETLNARLLAWLAVVQGANGSDPRPYSRDCHMLPQAAWVYSWDLENDVVLPEQHSCKHVLRYERLAYDFNKFMTARQYPYRLQRSNLWQQPSDARCRALHKGDLWP